METKKNQMDIDLDELQKIIAPLQSLLGDRHNGLYSWNKALLTQMGDLSKWIDTKWKTNVGQ